MVVKVDKSDIYPAFDDSYLLIEWSDFNYICGIVFVF